MDKKQIAAILKEMAVLMEIRGDNVFKIRAHENAARILEGLNSSVEQLVASGEITNIKGIGKGMADKITVLLEKGELEEHLGLKSSLPEGLLDIARVGGMGPKKVRAVWEILKITSLDELESAARAGNLAGMKGFGAKTEEKILKNIEMLKKFKDLFRLSESMPAAQGLVETLRGHEAVIRCDLAGSIRRHKEITRDIDLVASVKEAAAADVMTFFCTLRDVAEVIAQGDKKSEICLKNGIQAELRLVSDDQFPYALHHLTGSKEHNAAMGRRAIDQGLKMSEGGLFDGDEPIACENETEIFERLGLHYIPPELRENNGEIEAAQSNALPDLVRLEDLRGIIHAHSVWSDGANTIEEMALSCKERGYEYLAISDHSKAAAYANGLNEERIRQQHEEIDELNARLEGFRILKSIECDILGEGKLDFQDDVLALFDLVIISIHSRFNMTEAEGTNRIIKAMENPFATILGHMTGRLLLSRDGYPVNHHAVIDAAAELGVSIEINANPRRLDIDWRFCKYAMEKGLLISINPDAHRISMLDDMFYGVGVARKGWLSARNILNTRSAEEVLAFAQARR